MATTLLESVKTHYKTYKPYVLLKQDNKKYFVEVLDYKGNVYKPKRKSGSESPVATFNNYDSAHTLFVQMCLRYCS